MTGLNPEKLQQDLVEGGTKAWIQATRVQKRSDGKNKASQESDSEKDAPTKAGSGTGGTASDAKRGSPFGGGATSSSISGHLFIAAPSKPEVRKSKNLGWHGQGWNEFQRHEHVHWHVDEFGGWRDDGWTDEEAYDEQWPESWQFGEWLPESQQSQRQKYGCRGNQWEVVQSTQIPFHMHEY